MARRAGLAVRADRLRRGLIRRKAPSAPEHPVLACGFEENDHLAFLEPIASTTAQPVTASSGATCPSPTSGWTLVGPRCPQERL
jgi:hypothetical protein